MKQRHNIFLAILLAILPALLWSCQEDKFRIDPDLGEGESDINATVVFNPLAPALQSRAGGTPGNAIKKIESLCVFVYDNNGDLIKKFTTSELIGLTVDENGNTEMPGDAGTATPDELDNPHQAETSTPKAKFKIKLPFGRYRIYAAANMGDMPEEPYDYSTIESLKNIVLTWNQDDIAANNQMFGYFTTTADEQSAGFEAPLVTISQANTELHAWIKRAASKVTIAYNGTKLKPDVYIYLKTAEIKDIPATCLLGADNTPDDAKELIENGQTITYVEDDNFDDSYPALVTVDKPVYGMNPDAIGTGTVKEQIAAQHTETTTALYFYENMQGTGVDKAQDVDGDGVIDSPDSYKPDDPDYKDRKQFGSYIEVVAYYRSEVPGKKSSGKIIYRFMLGKNIKDDYNAQRNHHYKLTLNFNGYANDVDWHIEYETDPEIELPDPYYISYLYDKEAVIPCKIAGKIKPGTKLKGEIIMNGWWPVSYDEKTETFSDAPESQYYKPAVDTARVWNGFLSLRNTGNRTEISPGTLAADANKVNKDFWDKHQRGHREYDTDEGTHTSETDGVDDGAYTVSYDADKDITIFNIPYFTRAKNLVKASGYTGNNPYVSYQRRAIVRFTAEVWDPMLGDYKTITKDVNIIQVRRVVNPKGIWRAHNETAPFLVHLMRLETEFTTNPWTSDGKFMTFTSEGPWYAEIMVQGAYVNGAHSNTSWMKLTPELGSSVERNGRIEGEHGSEIKFTYQPNGACRENDVRYGIIKIRYHNYTCEHLIFVRQGYAPIPVANTANATVWYTFNLVTENEMATSPCDEGSLFKRFALDEPIRAVNNITYPFKYQITYDDLLWGATKNKLLQVNYKTMMERSWIAWGQPAGKDDPPLGGTVDLSKLPNFGEITADGINMKVATINDYLELYNDPDILYGFGVLYDGLADGVQVPVKDAYSYYAPYTYTNGTKFDGTLGANSKGRGMRGCFVYNVKTGAQIFLPIGAAGYGRRRQKQIINWDGSAAEVGFSPGMLIYANRDAEMKNPANLPLLFDIYRRPGANYWTNETQPGGLLGNSEVNDAAAWDFNYITFDFFPISKSNVSSNDFYREELGADKRQRATDALRIRCVVPSTSKQVTPKPEQ